VKRVVPPLLAASIAISTPSSPGTREAYDATRAIWNFFEDKSL
jgi:hypothetical protein